MSSMFWMQPAPATSATLLSKDRGSQYVAIRNLTIKKGSVSGELVNKSRVLIRDVQLRIRYYWHWKNEYHPGDESPGETIFYTVRKGIPPGKTTRFTYHLSTPLPSRTDGYFESTVSVAGFTKVMR